MKTDICIIGGGVVGCLMAAKLCGRGLKVVLLEAGPNRYRPDRYPHKTRDVYTNSGKIDYPLNTQRIKAVGGTTNYWGGYSPRMLDTDFKSKLIYGVADDWPINYDELESYYASAEMEMGVAGNSDNDFASFRSSEFPMPVTKIPADLKKKFENIDVNICSQPKARTTKVWDGRAPGSLYTAHAVHLPRALATKNLELITDATATRLELDNSGKIKRVVYSGLEDRSEKTQEASLFILACGGVETPRLLLLSSSGQFKSGLANSSGLVGKYFMEHSRVGVMCRFETPFSLLFPGPSYRVLSFQYYKRRKNEIRSAFLLTISGSPRPKDFIRQYYWGRKLRNKIKSDTNLQINIACTIEEIPHIDNSITLDPKVKDTFGNPAPRINFSLHSQTQKSIEVGRKLIQKIGQDLNPKSISETGIMFLAHHMGTCRMSSDPSKGVVNPFCIAHDVPNLMIVGSSTFVTCGSVNPTLTIVALTLRAVDFITKKYQRG